ncbi:hypothetical protein BH11PAT2_BH11PAT2_05240 [soil metagenome]
MDWQNLPFQEEGDVLRTLYLTVAEDDALKALAHEVGSTPSRLIRYAAHKVPEMCARHVL